jgi:hypothetical protein
VERLAGLKSRRGLLAEWLQFLDAESGAGREHTGPGWHRCRPRTRVQDAGSGRVNAMPAKLTTLSASMFHCS